MYTPLDVGAEEGEDSPSDEEAGLPMYQQASPARVTKPTETPASPLPTPGGRKEPKKVRLGNVWDSREELFSLGDDDEEDEDYERGARNQNGEGRSGKPSA